MSPTDAGRDPAPTDADRDSPPIDRDPSTGTDHDRETLDRRLEAVERALSEEEPLERADRLDDVESRVAELEAAVQALRGYVGSVRAVNEEIELRADRALRKAEAVERNVAPDRSDRGSGRSPDSDRGAATATDRSSTPGAVFGSDPEAGPGDAASSAADDSPGDPPTPLERLRDRL